MAKQTVILLGSGEQEAEDLIAEVRNRDAERFALETTGGLSAGRALILGNIEYIPPPKYEEAKIVN